MRTKVDILEDILRHMWYNITEQECVNKDCRKMNQCIGCSHTHCKLIQPWNIDDLFREIEIREEEGIL